MWIHMLSMEAMIKFGVKYKVCSMMRSKIVYKIVTWLLSLKSTKESNSNQHGILVASPYFGQRSIKDKLNLDMLTLNQQKDIAQLTRAIPWDDNG